MAAGRKIDDEHEARRCLLAARRANQTAGEWARDHGIDGRSLHAWKINFDKGRASVSRIRRAPAPRPVANALVELVPQSATMPGTRARYFLEVGGARLEFGDDASAETLGRVLEILRSC